MRGGGGSLPLEIFRDSAPLSSALPAAGLPEIFAGTFIAFPPCQNLSGPKVETGPSRFNPESGLRKITAYSATRFSKPAWPGIASTRTGPPAARTAVEELGSESRAYLDWLLGECIADDVEIDAVIEPAALDLMAQRLRTPLQFAEHPDRAFEAGPCTGQKPIAVEIVEAALAPDLDDLEQRLTRQGYSVKVLAEQFHARPTEIRCFLNGWLEAGRTSELADRMRTAGLAL